MENKITRQAWSTLQEITGIGVKTLMDLCFKDMGLYGRRVMVTILRSSESNNTRRSSSEDDHVHI